MSVPIIGSVVGLAGTLPVEDTPSSNVNIGVYAFVAFFILALTLWLLMRNMNARMRRMSYRHKVEDVEAAAAAQESEAAAVRRAAEERAARRQESATDGPGSADQAGRE